VLFDLGIPPLELRPIQAGDRYPVNFYAGFYRLPAKTGGRPPGRSSGWWPTTGRKVADCRAKGGPGHSC